MPYIPHTNDDIKSMLGTIGKKIIDDLFTSIPSKYRLKAGALNMDQGLSESQTREKVENIAGMNNVFAGSKSFIGGGAYNHFIPSAVNHIVSRSEFYTAYTPYQPEISQGTLQAIFEFQTMMCRLTGLDISNASMYDGATALAEAVVVAYKAKREKKKTVIVPKNLHPEYTEVLKNYLLPHGLNLVFADVDEKTGEISSASIKSHINADALCAIVQSPNYYGVVESAAKDIAATIKAADAVPIFLCIETTGLGMLKSPAELGFDIAVLEIQSLGNPIAFGGPYAGVIVAKNEYVRNLPGRIIGETKDVDGNRAYVLTLATREQHIRREKATSNICSNEALVALRTSVYLGLVGEEGFKDLARTNYTLAHYAKEQIEKINGLSIKYSGVFYNEFVVKFKSKDVREKAYASIKKEGFLPGLRLGDDSILVAVTELQSKSSIDSYVDALRRYAN